MKTKSASKLLTLFVGLSIALGARADITSGLVGYWSLSDGVGSSTASDLTSNANTATLTGFSDTSFTSMWTTPGDSVNGWPYAVTFNGGTDTGDYVSVPDIAPLDIGSNTKTFSVAMWVNASKAITSAGLLCKGTGGGGEAFCMDINGSKFRLFARNASGSSSVTCTATTGPAVGAWTHIVGTYVVSNATTHTPGALVYYVNGVQNNASVSTFTGMFNSSHVVSIGNRQSSTTTYNLPFSGAIDDVRIYNRVLSASDVAQLYANKAFNPANNGIGNWNGLAGSGGNATLGTTSLNFSTNIYSAPVGAGSLGNVLTLENGNALPPLVTFDSTYFSNGVLVSVAATNLTIAAGGVAVATANAAGTMNFANPTTTTYIVNSSDSIGIKDGPNPTSLVQSGYGTTILTGVNTFSGGVTINNGALQVGNGGSVTTHELGSASTVTDNANLVFNGANNFSFGTAITGTGGVIQKGSGTLTLTGANNYAGTTTIANGGLNVSSLSDAGSPISTGGVVLNAGALNYQGTGDTTTRQFTGVGGTTNTIDVPPAVTLEISGRVTGSAAWAVNKNDTGTLTLSGSADNSFLGMNVNAGTLILNKTSASGVHAIGNPLTVNSGATVQMSGSGIYQIYNNASTPVTINSGAVFDANGQSETFNKLTLAGNGSGSGALINSAASTISTITATGVLAANTTIGGTGSITLASAVSGPGSLTYTGAGTLTLGGANTYSGGTFVNSGLLDGSAAGSIPGSVTLSSTATLEIDNASTLPPTAVITLPTSPNNNIVNLNFSGTQTISALVIGSTSMPGGTYGAISSGATYENAAFTGSGLLYIAQSFWDANHTDAGSQSSANGGGSGNWDNATANWWVTGNADTSWSAGNVAYFAGTAGTVTLSDNVTAAGLTFTAPNYTINNVDGTSTLALGGTAPTITVPQGNTTVGCAITGSGTVTVSGPGNLNLNGANTYTGGTTIAGGTTVSANTVSDSGSGSLGIGGATTTLGTVGGQGANLNFTGSSGLTAGTVTLNGTNTSTINVATGGTLELDGRVGIGTATAVPLLTVAGGGTLILGGTADNGSLTAAINQGTVIINKSSASTAHGLGGGNSSLGTGSAGNSAILQLSGSGGFDLYSSCVLTINSPDGMLDLNGQTDSMSTLTLSGAGPTGAGALINNAASTTSVLTNGGSGVVLAGPTTIGGAGNVFLMSKVSGTGPITAAGSGTLILGGASTYTGGTIINAGNTVLLTNNATAAGTAAITVNASGTLNVGVQGNNVIVPNDIVGTGTINLVETSANNLQLGGSLSGFTGVLNCPASPGGAAKAQILTTGVNINSAATINLAALGTLYLANSGVVIPCPLNIYGTGNTEAYGALRIENGALISGPVTLFGNTTIGNGQAGPTKLATISGPIHESGGSYGITFTSEPGTIVLSGVNTYTGPTTINKGVIIIGGAGQLGAGNYAGDIVNNASNLTFATTAPQTLGGSISGGGILIEGGPGTLTLTGSSSYTGDTWITNGSTLAITSSGSIGSGNYTANVLDNGTLTYASSAPQTLSGVVSGTGGVTVNGASTLSLNGINTYTGNTLVTNGATLIVTGGASIDSTAAISIGAGSTADVSANDPYTIGANTTLQASGVGTGATAATLKGGNSVTLGAIVLNYKPQSFSGDLNNSALNVVAGSLALNGNSLTVNNATGTPLGAGTYSLIQASGGSISLANNNVTVTGAGLAAGMAASVSVSGGNVLLNVSSGGTIPQPKITNIAFANGNVVFSGTNGVANGTYYVLGSTNVSLSLSNWTAVATNTFDSAGAFTVTNAPQGTTQRYFIIDIKSP